MSEGGEARCFDCGKTPETCWLPPYLCKHPDREGGEPRAIMLADGRAMPLPRSPQGEDRSAGRWCAICGEHGGHHTDRHPQGEDHEAGKERLREMVRRAHEALDETRQERDEARAEAAKWEALARRLYALMGEEAERLMPGGLDA